MANNCGSFCQCEALKENTCYFGPDAEGVFVKEIGTSSKVVDSCDTNFCLCDTHEFPEETNFEQEL